MEKVTCKARCGFEDEFEPDDFGVNYYQAIGVCPNCQSPTVYIDGDETKVVVMFSLKQENNG